MIPTILMDMDGPLADFDLAYWQAAHKIHREKYDPKVNGSTFDIDSMGGQRHRFLSDHVNQEAVESDARKLVNTPGWFAGLSVTPGAKAGMAALAEFADVWIVSKPLEANPSCRDEKAAWLVKNIGPEWERKLILTSDKSLVVGDVLVDDAIKRVWLHRAVWSPVVFKAPFNEPDTTFGRDWERWSWVDTVSPLLEHAHRVCFNTGNGAMSPLR